MDGIINAISNLFNGNVRLATIIMSLIPLIELKGGIVYAWGSLGFIKSFLYAYIGSTIVFVGVFFLLKPILALLKKWKAFRGFAEKIESYFENKAKETEQKQNDKKIKLTESRLKQLGVFIFVAIPLPMTGVWTGTAVAVFLGLNFEQVVLPIIIGNFIAGLLICGLSALCALIGISLDLVLCCLLGLAVILLFVTILKVSRQKKNAGEKDA